MSEPKTYAWYWVSDLTFLSCSSALAGVLGGTPSTSLALASVSLDPTLSCVIIGSLATFSAFWFNEPKGGESGQGTLPEQRTAEEPANLADTGDLAVREDVHVGQECCDAVGGTGNASHSDTIGPDRPAAEILLCARALFSPGKISVLIASGPSASLELAAGVSFRSCSTKPARRTQSSASI